MKILILISLILSGCALFKPKCKEVCPEFGDDWDVKECTMVCEGDEKK